MNREPWLQKRQSGILLPTFANPGNDAIGTLNDTYVVAQIFKRFGQTVLQRLPLGPTSIGDSPFQGPSTLAGNPNLISLEVLVKAGDLSEKDYYDYLKKWEQFKSENPGRSNQYCEYGFLWEHKLGFDITPGDFNNSVLRKAFQNHTHNQDQNRISSKESFFAEPDQEKWLNDFAIFMALKQHYGFSKQWNEWNCIDKFRKSGFGKDVKNEEIEFHKYLQFVFDEQATTLTTYLRSLGLTTIGNFPFSPAYDSCDVWQNPYQYQLDTNHTMTHVAGVPPDYYEPEKGQLWGNPVRRWGIVGSRDIQEKVFESFVLTVKRVLRYNDVVERDHSRGYTAYGRTLASERDARNARWIPGPGNKLLEYLENILGHRPKIIDENLGVITYRVKKNLRGSGNPGMQVLVFVYPPDPKNPHLVEKSTENSVFYTGTQNNEPVLEFLESRSDRELFENYFSQHSTQPEIHFRAIETVASSRANLAIYQAQDTLGYGRGTRTNKPGGIGYWRWRMTDTDLLRFEKEIGPRLLEISKRHNRI